MYLSKICPICGETFFPNSGHQKRCDECAPEFLRAYRIKNAIAWNKKHTEEALKHRRAWRVTHRQKEVLVANKQRDLRRGYGYVMLNAPFLGSAGHHVDPEHVLFIPKELHRSIKHNLHTGENMTIINDLAYKWLREAYHSC